MAGELEVGIPHMRYDITAPLLEGRVPIEGVALKVQSPTMPMIFSDNPRLRAGDFDVWELNLGYLLAAIEAGWEFVALPLFVKRKPVYPLLFCRADLNISLPSDMNGKRVGSRTYSTALTIWARGLLRQYHGVDLTSLTWCLAGTDFFPLQGEQPIIEKIDGKKNIADWLIDGDVNVLMSDVSDAKLFERLEGDSRIKRVFPDYVNADKDLYRAAGIYPPVHALVMSKRLNREHPELAGTLCAAFGQAKTMAYDEALGERGSFALVYQRERLKEQQAEWGDPWAYGIKANRSTIDAFVRYNVEQGLIRHPMADAQVFAASTLDS